MNTDVVITAESEEVSPGHVLSERRKEQGYATLAKLCEAAQELELEDAIRFKAFGPSSLSAWENDVTGERIGKASNKTLRTLSYLLGWSGEDFKLKIGFPIGSVPRVDHENQRSAFSFVERYGVRFRASIRLPIYGSVAAGIEGFESAGEPEGFDVFDDWEVPRGVDPKTLYLIWANGNSIYEVGMQRPIPNGSKLMIQHGAAPEDKQVVVAYIPERDIGVVKQYRRGHNGEGVMLTSFQAGGPTFMASDYPSMYVSGIVRRVVYEMW